MEKIGIEFKVRAVNGAYPPIQTRRNNMPISSRPAGARTTPTR